VVSPCNQKIILASGSPRRAHLLRLIGLEFEVIPSTIEEEAINEQEPAAHVLNLSLAKARDVAARIDEGLIVGADTIVVLDGEILGKPKDALEATAMLKRLSGRTHEVFTGFALIKKPGSQTTSDYETTNVHFRFLQDWEIESYVKTQSPMDKAGAYGIQDQSAVFADKIEGCFYNVVGFPLTKFYTTLLHFLEKKPE
jgi:septum formation protein